MATDFGRARERARAIDDHRAKGDPLGPLAGLPMTIKDTFDIEGMAASSGREDFRRGRRPDAIVVSHVRHAGAVIWGKTNTPVMAGDFQTYNRLYGVTNNPWDRRAPAAARPAAAAAALATGSPRWNRFGHRRPAHAGVVLWVYSHKPTGRVSQVATAAGPWGPFRATSTWSGRWPARHATHGCCSWCWRPAPGGPHPGPAGAGLAADRPVAGPAGIRADPEVEAVLEAFRRTASPRRRRVTPITVRSWSRPCRAPTAPCRAPLARDSRAGS
jgi:hypothetical protein